MKIPKIAFLYILIGILIAFYSPYYSLDKSNTIGARERYAKLVYILHEIKPLQDVVVSNFGKTTYIGEDCSIFFFFSTTKTKEEECDRFIEYFNKSGWKMIKNDNNEVIFENCGIKAKVFSNESNVANAGENNMIFTLLITDIREDMSKKIYKNKEFLRGMF